MIIGIAGKKGTGKTYLAEKLKSEIRAQLVNVRIESLASPIKHMVAAITGSPLNKARAEELYKRVLKSRPLPQLGGYSPRKLAQHVGQAMRDLDEDFWINLLDRRREVGVTIVDDVRFDNEMEYIIDNGGIIIHLEAGWLDSDDAHPSENGISGAFSTQPNYFNLSYTSEDTRAAESRELVKMVMERLFNTVE